MQAAKFSALPTATHNQKDGDDQLSAIFERLRNKEEGAIDDLLPLVYTELRKFAQYQLSSKTQITLQPTVLVNDILLQLLGKDETINFTDREHFFKVASQSMRWLVVDHFRRKHSEKRGGKQVHISLDEVLSEEHNQEPVYIEANNIDFIALDSALTQLASLYPREAKVVELRYYVGLSEAQTAEILGVSERSVRRDWVFAKAWLLEKLS